MKPLRIMHIGSLDPCGSGYWLSRGINQFTPHHAVNVRFVDDWSRTPAYIWASKYGSQAAVKRMILKADVLHFSDFVEPFFSAFDLDPKVIQQKRCLVYYHGTLFRNHHEHMRAAATELLGDHAVTVSTPDLLAHVEDGAEAYWLPVIRDWEFIRGRYGWSAKDRRAQAAFGEKKLVTIGHPASDIEKKGSKFFFGVLTDIMRFNRNVRSSIVFNTPWDSAMRKIAEYDILLANAAPIASYGLAAVEAAVFRIPAVTYMTEEGYKMYEDIVGERPPLVCWTDFKNLFHKLQQLCEYPDARAELGAALDAWMRPLHDTEAVVQRYLKMVTQKR